MANETLADRLRRRRIALGFEYAADAARQYGWNVRTYQAHENGNKEPSKKAVQKYLETYRMTYDELVTGKKQPRPKPDQPLEPFLALRAVPVLDITTFNGVHKVNDMLKLQPKRMTYVKDIKELEEHSRAIDAPDDSMVDPATHDERNISKGEEVIFVSGKELMPGDIVVAKLYKPERVVIRQYANYAQADGRRGVRLIPRNRHYPEDFIFSIDDGFIIGRVRRVQSGRNM